MKEFGPPGVIFFSDGFVGVVPEVGGALLLGLVGLMVSLGFSGVFVLQPAALTAISIANPIATALRTVALGVISRTSAGRSGRDTNR